MKKAFRIKGQSLVEFAFVFPLFFFLVTGLFDLGRAIFAFSTLNTAAREGTRFAIVQPKGTVDSVFLDRVDSYFFNNKDLYQNSIVTISHVGTTEDPKIMIHIAYTFSPITPGLSAIMGSGNKMFINVESIMRLAPVAR